MFAIFTLTVTTPSGDSAGWDIVRSLAFGKGGVTQTVTERKNGSITSVEMAIADIDAFYIMNLAVLAGVIAEIGIVFAIGGQCVREFSRGIDVAKEDRRQGIATFLAGKPGLHQRRHLADPVFHRHRRAVVQHDNGFSGLAAATALIKAP